MFFANIYYDLKKYEPVNSMLEKELQILIPENAKVMGPIEFWMFLPKTEFKSTNYRWGDKIDLKQLPSKFKYFIVSDKMNFGYLYKINREFKQYSGSKLIYETYSKNYGKIELYLIKI